ERDRQHARRQRIKRAGMACLLRIEDAADRRNGVRGRHVVRLVEHDPARNVVAFLAAAHDPKFSGSVPFTGTRANAQNVADAITPPRVATNHMPAGSGKSSGSSTRAAIWAAATATGTLALTTKSALKRPASLAADSTTAAD